jgi:hypothetical protein
LLHDLEQAEHGRIRQLGAPLVQRVAQVADGCLAALPEHFEGFELALGGLDLSHGKKPPS